MGRKKPKAKQQQRRPRQAPQVQTQHRQPQRQAVQQIRTRSGTYWAAAALQRRRGAPVATPASRVLFRTPDLFGHVCALVGSTRHLAATNRAGRAQSTEVKTKFVARYLYVIPLEGDNRTAPMVPQAGARLHLATQRWEAVQGAHDDDASEATAFIPTLHALPPAPRGAQDLSFYAQGRLSDEPRTDAHFVFNAETSRWARRPSALNPSLSGLAVFARVGRTLYVIGGVDHRVSPSLAVRRLEGDAWLDCAPLNRPRFAPSVCAVPNGLAVLGGFSTVGDADEGLEATLTTERYDATSNTWTRGPDLVFFGHEGDVLTAAMGDDVFALESHYGSGSAARLQRWRGHEIVRCAALAGNHAPVPGAEPRTFSTNVLLADPTRGRLLAMDGLIDNDDALTSSTVTIHAYDVKNDTWAPLIHLANPALGFTALRHGDGVYFPIRGEPLASGRETTAIGCLDLETDAWRPVGGATALLDPRRGPLFCVGDAPE
jgi:hypothetical protein